MHLEVPITPAIFAAPMGALVLQQVFYGDVAFRFGDGGNVHKHGCLLQPHLEVHAAYLEVLGYLHDATAFAYQSPCGVIGIGVAPQGFPRRNTVLNRPPFLRLVYGLSQSRHTTLSAYGF